jgi:hypothetical protein
MMILGRRPTGATHLCACWARATAALPPVTAAPLTVTAASLPVTHPALPPAESAPQGKCQSLVFGSTDRSPVDL